MTQDASDYTDPDTSLPSDPPSSPAPASTSTSAQGGADASDDNSPDGACEVPYSQKQAPPAAPAPGAQGTYQVPPGATWDDIAADTGVDVNRILVANNIDPSTSPLPDPTEGAYIVIPSGVRDACIAPANSNSVDLGLQCNALITSSNITVDGVDFVSWFNKKMRGTHGPIFGSSIGKDGFKAAWDNVKALTGKDGVVLNEFVAHLMIMYNETGGTLLPSPEGGTAPYFFERRLLHYADGTPYHKASYNSAPNRPAGDLLSNGLLLPPAAQEKLKPFVFDAPVITSAADIAAWNATAEGSYPSSAPADVQQAAQECDFFKFRGRGINQLTWRTNYLAIAGPSIQANYNCSIDDLTTSQLDDAFRNPLVYLDAFRRFCSKRGSIASVLQGSFAAYGTAVSGSQDYGSGLYTNRCVALRDTMLKANVTIAGPGSG